MRRLLTRAAVGSIALTLAGCSHHHHAAAIPANDPGSPCRVIGVTYVDQLRPHHLTFEDVVRNRATHAQVVGVGAGLAFTVGMSGSGGLGPYGPAVGYLVHRYAGQRVGPPSKQVIASARALDADLAHGLCKGYRTGSDSSGPTSSPSTS